MLDSSTRTCAQGVTSIQQQAIDPGQSSDRSCGYKQEAFSCGNLKWEGSHTYVCILYIHIDTHTHTPFCTHVSRMKLGRKFCSMVYFWNIVRKPFNLFDYDPLRETGGHRVRSTA